MEEEVAERHTTKNGADADKGGIPKGSNYGGAGEGGGVITPSLLPYVMMGGYEDENDYAHDYYDGDIYNVPNHE